MKTLNEFMKVATKEEVEEVMIYINKLELKKIKKTISSKRNQLRKVERILEAMKTVGFEITADMQKQYDELKKFVVDANKLLPKKTVEKK